MTNVKRIPIPWSQRWRRIRYSFLPGMFFVLCVGLTIWLWQRERILPNAVGEVEAVRLDVAASADGTLVPLSRGHWSLFETVVAHEIIARLDDRLVKMQLDVLQKELVQLRNELQATAEKESIADFERRQTHLREVARLTMQMENNRLNVLDRQVQVEYDRIDLKRRQFHLEYLESLHKNNVVSELNYQDEKMLRDQVEVRLTDNLKALDEAKKQQQEAQRRLEILPEYKELELETLLKPLNNALDTQQARITEVQLQIDNLEIRAPITGTICAIYRWPGQAIRAGDPIMTIAADNGRYIVSYIRQEQILRPQPGSTVLIKARQPKATTVASTIEQLGSQMELIPQHQRRNIQLLEWGVPVRIAMPKGFSVKPGELVDVSFQ